MKNKIIILLLLCIIIFPIVNAVSVGSGSIAVDIPDSSISSNAWVEVKTLQFNTSELLTVYGGLNSMNLEQINRLDDMEVYINITVDGVEIYSDLLRTTTTGEPGISGTAPFVFSVANGIHEITIAFRRDSLGNQGTVGIYNIDFSIGEFISNIGNDIRGNLSQVSTDFTSLTPVTIFTHNITRNVNTSTYVSGKFNMRSDGGSDVVVCEFLDGGDSPDFVVTVPGSGETRSVSSMYITEPEAMSNILNMSCFSTNGEQIFVSGSIIEADMSDDLDNSITHISYTNPLTNYTNPVILSAGDNLLINQSYTPGINGSTFFTASSSFASNSGSQIPIGKISLEKNGVEVCSSLKERYTDGDIGNGFFYKLCENVTAGVTYRALATLTVPAGETLILYDGGIALFDNYPINISIINTPPIITITSPEVGENVVGQTDVMWTITDTQEDSTLTNITLSNATGDFIVAQYLPTGVVSFTLNTSLYATGVYNLTASVCENETADLFCDSNTVEVFLITLPDPQCGDEIPARDFIQNSRPFSRLCEWNDFNSNFIFTLDETFTLSIKMTNYDLSECANCTCEYSVFQSNGEALFVDYVGVVEDSYCIYRNVSMIQGRYTYEMIMTNAVDYGRVTGSFQINEYGIPAISFGLYALFYIFLLFLSFLFWYKFATKNGVGVKDPNFFLWSAFLDLVLYVLIEIYGFGGVNTLVVDVVKMICFASGAYFLVMGIIYSLQWKN